MMDEGSRKVLDKVGGADYVEVMFAKTLEEAKACCSLLEEENIPARYEKSADATDDGIAILVPEDHFVDATEILSSRTQEHVDEDDEDLAVDDELENIDDAEEEEEFEDDDDDELDDDADDDSDEDTEEEDDY